MVVTPKKVAPKHPMELKKILHVITICVTQKQFQRHFIFSYNQLELQSTTVIAREKTPYEIVYALILIFSHFH